MLVRSVIFLNDSRFCSDPTFFSCIFINKRTCICIGPSFFTFFLPSIFNPCLPLFQCNKSLQQNNDVYSITEKRQCLTYMQRCIKVFIQRKTEINEGSSDDKSNDRGISSNSSIFESANYISKKCSCYHNPGSAATMITILTSFFILLSLYLSPFLPSFPPTLLYTFLT